MSPHFPLLISLSGFVFPHLPISSSPHLHIFFSLYPFPTPLWHKKCVIIVTMISFWYSEANDRTLFKGLESLSECRPFDILSTA